VSGAPITTVYVNAGVKVVTDLLEHFDQLEVQHNLVTLSALTVELTQLEVLGQLLVGVLLLIKSSHSFRFLSYFVVILYPACFILFRIFDGYGTDVTHRVFPPLEITCFMRAQSYKVPRQARLPLAY
jgi:hypothetical protein